jgi:hypothetical protein
MHWLVLAALADWLIARTLTRLAIFMPKSPAVVHVYQAVGMAGQLATTLAALLGLGALGWIAWREWRAGSVWLPPLLVSLMLFSLVFLVVPPAGWLALANQVLSVVAVGVMLIAGRLEGSQGEVGRLDGWMVGWLASLPTIQPSSHPTFPSNWKRMRAGESAGRVALLLPALAFLAGRLHQAVSTLYTAMHWPGPPWLAGTLFNLGELLVVLGAFGVWWAYGRGVTSRTWLAAALPALAFAGMRLAAPAMTGILAVWSIGLTLYLPWPLYAASLWLAGVTVLVALRRGDLAAWALLLLAAGGYAPQLSSQVFLTLIALWLLSPGMNSGLVRKVR